uniref:Uncharacterized protein n=1 Tax=Anguilla anguilla TaxID=7936 RepID=A0A0E9VG91_ANGAN
MCRWMCLQYNLQDSKMAIMYCCMYFLYS